MVTRSGPPTPSPAAPGAPSPSLSAGGQTTSDEQRAREALATVVDPEIPVLTVEDLGILRGVAVDGGEVVVTITPTYSGCPAMETITRDVHKALGEAGFTRVRVDTVYAPAWTTDWMSEEGRRKLAGYGIAPPGPVGDPGPVLCPRCATDDIRLVSYFGSTACKALMVCEACGEPFDHFKHL
ncbi:MAG: 1,2-phenylacetyl-CoA epoxidase subunit PaaD [Acidimicrobiia bacterium]|jgi:ring-1,2-phenylacetyl-CoA epoxidase subunit PaaD